MTRTPRVSRLLAVALACLTLVAAVVVQPRPAAAAGPIEPFSSGTLTNLGDADTVGSTLEYTPATWAIEEDARYIQWLRCLTPVTVCASIPGVSQSATSYVVQPGDIGSYIQIVEMVVRSGEWGESWSNTIGPITPVSLPPSLTGAAPSITGDPILGQTLVANPGEWSGTQPITFFYSWESCETATGDSCYYVSFDETLTLTADHVGRYLFVTAEASNGIGYDSARTPVGVGPVAWPPVPTFDGEVTVTGSPTAGGTLTAEAVGTWDYTGDLTVGYQWLRCDRNGPDCDYVDDAYEATYVITDADYGYRIAASVYGMDDNGTGNEYLSVPTAVVADPAWVPASTERPPAISGAPFVGETLTVNDGTWSGEQPMTFSYQWFRCLDWNCTPIDGATANTYTATDDDAGYNLVADVAATNEWGSGLESTGPTDTIVVTSIPLNVDRPTIVGTAEVGQTLTATTGTWTGTEPIAYSVQWYRCIETELILGELPEGCSPIDGANDSEYVVTDDDVADTLAVRVRATNQFGFSFADTDLTSVVPAVAPYLVAGPDISGTAAVGQQLATTTGIWGGTGPFSFLYQWMRCNSSGGACEPIEAATSSTYTVTVADVGHRLRGEVTVIGDGGSNFSRTESSAVVPAVAPQNVDSPAISGELRIGETLTATPGVWEGEAPIDYAYQWLRCDELACTEIDGATGSTYTLVSDDFGATISVTVTATNGAGSTSASATTGEIGADPLAGPAPVVSGLARVGETLTATVGSWTGTGPIAYTWSWQRCTGITCVTVPGTAATYVVQADDAGSTMRAVIHVAGAVETAEKASTPTAVVVPPPGGNLDAEIKSNGETITVSGSDWLPGSQVGITLHSDPVFLGYATAGDDGTFTVTFPVPAGTPGGAHHVVLEGLDFAGNPATVELPVTINVPDGRGPFDPPAPPAPPADPRDLPRTGADTVPLLVVGLVLFAAGGALFASSLLRRTPAGRR